jgi:predicted 3-demethylubiquinone-9 3-methyltransferase (glyoxalase superfamily)
MQIQQRITPFLPYPNQAEEAAEFYVSVLPDSRILRKVLNPMNQSILTVEFSLCGMKFIALNAGREDWKFTEAFSLAIHCDTQNELDSLWSSLLANGGTELACGWLKDKFGMCWQVWPTQLQDWFKAEDPVKLQRMFEALWQMKKLDIATLQKAFEGST